MGTTYLIQYLNIASSQAADVPFSKRVQTQ